MQLSKNHIMEELNKGICEMTIISEHCSLSKTISATLSSNHLPDMKPTVSAKPNIVVFWNMIDEKWQTLHLSTIGDIERLTGNGVKQKEDAFSINSIAPFANH